MVRSSHCISLMRPERGYHRSAYTADTDSSQRGNSCCSAGSSTTDRGGYTEPLSLTVSWNVIGSHDFFLWLCCCEYRDINSPEPVFQPFWAPNTYANDVRVHTVLLLHKWSIKTDSDWINSASSDQMSSTPVTTVSLCRSLFRGGQKLGSLCVETGRMATCSSKLHTVRRTGQGGEELTWSLKRGKDGG